MSSFHLDSDIEEIASRLGDVANDLAGKTVIMTGARGFLGRYFSLVFDFLNRNVLATPCTVIALDNLLTAGEAGAWMPDHAGVCFIKHNVIERFDWTEPVHYVVHAASIASPYYYRAYPLETLDVAVHGTRHMLELATRNKARFTYFSSSEIYGDPDPKHVPTQESYRGYVSCRGPRACYDESKRVGETLCYIFHERFGTATTTIRPFNVFGPGMQENDYRVLPNFASRIKGELPLNVYGAGTQTRTFCYIADAMVGFLLTVLRGIPGEAYNIGNPNPEISMVDLILRIEKVLGRKLAYNVIEYPDSYPADEPIRRCPDIRKARLQLKYEPQVDLDEALRRYLSWTDAVYTGKQ